MSTTRDEPMQPLRTLKRFPYITPLFFLLFFGGICGCEKAVSTPEPAIEVCFSPGGQCTKFIEEAIAKAQKTILVQAYTFTSTPIANALIAAQKRGVYVSILVDKSQRSHKTGRGTKVRKMAWHGILVAVDVVEGIAHNKVMIIDDDYVLTGSFNWSDAAETKNSENLLLIKDTKVNAIYKANWHKRAGQSEPL